jgi:uroporphyrinogen decarboxylase
MRQAGRCLADYRKLRERYSILTLAKTPDLCAEVTVMPVEAFGVDAAVLFADIMLPLEPMGVSLEIQPEVGPIIHAPVRSRAAVDGLRVIDPDEEVRFVMEAIRLVRRELDSEQAVIGFSGAPFTRQPLDAAWERIGFDRGIQGNLDATRVLGACNAQNQLRSL